MAAIPKQKRVKLHGAELRALNDAIHERDNQCCIACGVWVSEGQKFHHYPYGANKSDEIEKGVLLCYTCHNRAHGRDIREYNSICEEYLSLLY